MPPPPLLDTPLKMCFSPVGTRPSQTHNAILTIDTIHSRAVTVGGPNTEHITKLGLFTNHTH